MNLKDLPAVKYLCLLSFGLIIGMILELPLIMAFILSCLLFFMSVLIKKDIFKNMVLIVCIIFCGCLRVSLYKENFDIRHAVPEGRDSVKIMILKQKTNPYYIESYAVKAKIGNENIKGTLYAKKDMSVLIPGRSYVISDLKWTPISGDRNPYVFDYLSYARVKGLSHSFHVQKNSDIKELGITHPLIYYAQQLKNEISVRYLAVLGIEKGSLVNGLLLGLKSEIPSCLSDLFRQLGISHLLAVSGLHVGLIMLIIYQILLTLSVPRVPRVLLIGVFLVFYCFITGGSPSVIRSSLMSLMLMLAPVFKRKYQALNAVAASAVILLLANPLSLMDLGFQFSYSAVFGILIAYPKIKRWFGKRKRQKAVDYVIDMISVSLSAALFTSPVAIYYFNSLQMASMLLNIVVIPLTFCVMICAILTLPGLFFQGVLADIFLNALDLSLNAFRFVLRLASRSEIWTLTVSSYWKPLIFALIMACLILICIPGKKPKFISLIVCSSACMIWFAASTRPEVILPDLKKGHVMMFRRGRTALIVNTGSQYYNYNDYDRSIQPVLEHWGTNEIIVIVDRWQKQNTGNIGRLLREYPGSRIYAAPGDEAYEMEIVDMSSDTSIMLMEGQLKIISENKMLCTEYKINKNTINYCNDSLKVNEKRLTAKHLISFGNMLFQKE